MILTNRNQHKINVKKQGKGKPTLIFTHGWVNNLTIWESIIKELKKNYTCISHDIIGHGISDNPVDKRNYTLESFAKDVDEIIKKFDIENYVLIGHSMGGMISLHHEATRQKAKGLILIDTTTNLDLYNFKKAKTKLKYLVKRLPHYDTSSFLHKEEVNLHSYGFSTKFAFLGGLRNTPLHAVINCLETMIGMNLNEEAKQITKQTLIIHGSKDTTLSLKHGKKLRKLIKNSTLNIYENDNHLVPLNSVTKVIKDIKEFLNNDTELQ